MSLLEERYRSVLRLLPASYRAGREEEMVAAFMESSGDTSDEVNAYPRWGEVASVAALSLRVRLGGPGASPRAFAWGETVRILAVLGLAFQSLHAAFAVAALFRTAAPSLEEASIVGAPGSFERLMAIGESGTMICWAVAFVALMRARPGLAKIAAVCAATPAVVYFLLPVIETWPSGARPLPEVANLVFAVVPVIALLLGFHRDVPLRPRPWALTLAPLAASGVALAWVQGAVALGLHEFPSMHLWLDLVGMVIPVWVAGALFLLVRRPSPAWALAMSAAGTLLMMLRVPLLAHTPEGIPWGMVCAQCVLLEALAVALAWAGVRALPRRPAPQGKIGVGGGPIAI